VTTETAQLFFALLTFVAAAGAIGLVGLRVASARSQGASQLGSAISDAGVWLAFIVAATATVGSLYFSEVAEFIPCRLCWFQRIAMYPLSVVLLVGAIRHDPSVRWYAGPLAGIGALIAAYHTLIEWRPELDNGTCDLSGPSCTAVWFREFGFISLALMSLVAFVTILALLFVRFPATMEGSDGGDSESPNSSFVKDAS
jgi:disulfide bond formation protein DsbB